MIIQFSQGLLVVSVRKFSKVLQFKNSSTNLLLTV